MPYLSLQERSNVGHELTLRFCGTGNAYFHSKIPSCIIHGMSDPGSDR